MYFAPLFDYNYSMISFVSMRGLSMRRMILQLRWIVLCFAMLVMMAMPSHVQAATRAQNVGDELVVVIDAGHGGENLGAKDFGTLEKDRALITALAMYDELSKYEGVKVYMTRTADVDMSLEERAQLAKDVGADFLFSVHYNASENHKRYGSEILVSTQAPYNGYAYQFGSIALENFSQMGLYNRGIKARQGTEGDYYGLLRECSKRGVPSTIIEHCHIDNETDAGYADTTDDLKKFGQVDAKSVAQYFGLKSSTLGVDYSSAGCAEADVSKPVPVTLSDGDGLDELEVSLWSNNPSSGDVTVRVHGFDHNAAILYYEYSLDAGITYTPLYRWPNAQPLINENDNDFNISFNVPEGSTAAVIVRAYNIFDYDSSSNLLDLNAQVLQTEYQQGKALSPVSVGENTVTNQDVIDWHPADYADISEAATNTTELGDTSAPAANGAAGQTSTVKGPGWLAVLVLAVISLLIVLLLALVIRLFVLEHSRDV